MSDRARARASYPERMRRHLLPLLVLLCASLVVHAETLTPAEIERLASLGKVWGAARYAHPAFGYRDVAWDAATVRAIERARDGALPEAAQELLASLGDPMTRVVERCTRTAQDDEQRAPETLAHGVVLLDLRATACGAAAPWLAELEPQLVHGSVTPPGERRVRHWGFRTQLPGQPTPYHSSFVIAAGGPVHGTRSEPLRALVLVVDARSTLTPALQALVRTRKASLLAVGPVHDELFTSHLRVPVADGFEAVIRTGEPSDDEGRAVSAVVTTIAASSTDAAVREVALQMTRPMRRRSIASRGPQREEYVLRIDDAYVEQPFPDFAHRVLAAYRLWNTIDQFYPYKHLIGPWEPRFADILARLAAASDELQYELALAEVSTFVPDGHTRLVGADRFAEIRGVAFGPFYTMQVEGKPIVVEMLDASAQAAGIAKGDEVVSVDGQPAGERLELLARHIPGSTEAMVRHYATLGVTVGADGSTAVIGLRRPDGSIYSATVRRSLHYGGEPPAEPWSILPEGVGYVDLNYLEPKDVARMLTALAGTRGLILDMRGYPRGTAMELARRLARTGTRITAQVIIPIIDGGMRGEELILQENLYPPGTLYTAPTVTLIDERAQSQAEHLCLAVESMNDTIFVGSPTAGANGPITHVALPGGIWFQFTGTHIRHADGRQLQRVGIIPDVSVPRTIEALRAGRDEVLEKAIEMLLAP
jgi:C-terminal processing protease CtpA/Prc